MSDDSGLRMLAREAMQAGTLPDLRPGRIWGGPGSGAECAVCGKTIGCDEPEFELQHEHVDSAKTYHAHVHCFAAWELERDSRGATDRTLPGEGNNDIINASERYTRNGGERK